MTTIAVDGPVGQKAKVSVTRTGGAKHELMALPIGEQVTLDFSDRSVEAVVEKAWGGRWAELPAEFKNGGVDAATFDDTNEITSVMFIISGEE